MSQELVNAFKQIAKSVNDNAQLTAFMIGEVNQIEPLKVRVEDRFDINEDSIIVMRQFIKDEPYDDHWHTIQPVDTTVVDKHKHKTEPHITDIAYYRGLKVGDKVVLLRNTGGQQFLILGRV